MKVVILAGGQGTRISEESHLKPKPMIEIGGKPILWHIMKAYAHYGHREFIICCGYRGYVIKEYFANYFLHNADVTFDLSRNGMTVHHHTAEDWSVTLVDTGADTLTGGRIRRIKRFVEMDDFCLTYGDGVGNIPINDVIGLHQKEKVWATVSAVRAPARFGSIGFDKTRVKYFFEKPEAEGGYINGGFFVLSPTVFEFLKDDYTIWEREPMQTITQKGQMAAYFHTGFWHPMDTLRDKNYLEELWNKGNPPWKLWQ